MEKSIAFIRAQALGGNYQKAAACAASIRAGKGDQPEAAIRLAAQAAAADSGKLLALALALWPQARSGGSERFLSELGGKTAAWCARRDPELAQAAGRLRAKHSAQQELARRQAAGTPSKAASAGEQGEKKAKGTKRARSVAMPPPSMVIVKRWCLPKGWATTKEPKA